MNFGNSVTIHPYILNIASALATAYYAVMFYTPCCSYHRVPIVSFVAPPALGIYLVRLFRMKMEYVWMIIDEEGVRSGRSLKVQEKKDIAQVCVFVQHPLY